MSAEASYVPGSWVAIAGPGAWLLVSLPPDHEIVQRCWSLLSAGAEAEDVLDALVTQGIRATPAFALVRVADNERRAIARGAASVALIDETGAVDVKVAANERSVWTDEPFGEDVDVLLLTNNETTTSTVELPMAVGVTMAASVRVRTRAQERPPIQRVSSPDEARTSPNLDIPPAAAPVTAAPMPPADAPPPQARPMPPPVPAPVAPTAAVPPPAAEDAPSYDFLFGATQRPIPLTPQPAGPPAAPEPFPVAQSDATAGWSTIGPGSLPVAEPPAPVVEPPPPAAAPAGGLIDSLPWATPADSTSTSPAVVDEAPADVSMTVDRAALRESAATSGGPLVLAGRCPNGHLSPPHAPYCRACRAPMPPGQDGVEIVRPPLGVLRLSTGDVVTLDRGVLLGRAPEAVGGGEERPHLVRLVSPENDISRSHAEIVLDGWLVYVRDLNSTNGTVVTLPGQPPTRLRANDLQLLEHGALVTLADEVSVRFEVTG